MIKKTKWGGKIFIVLLLFSFVALFNFSSNPIQTVNAASGSFSEDFTTTTYMDGAETNTSGWGTGAIKNSRKKPAIIGSISSALIGSTIDVLIEGEYAYVTNQEEGLKVVNITDSTNPNIVGTYSTADLAQSVFIEDNYVYIADYHGDEFWVNFQILDITDPSTPVFLGNCSTFDYARDVVVDGSYAYVANSESGLSIIDVSNPSNPSQVRIRDTTGISYDLAIDGDYAYVADGANGLVVIDISNPLTPTIVAHFSTGISSAISIVLEGNYAYVVDINNGVIVVNITVPTTPSFVSSWLKNGASDAYVYGDFLYVLDINDGISVLNKTDLTTLKLFHTLSLPGVAQAIHIKGNYAYINCQTGGFQVVQIADPSAPYLAGSYKTDFALGVCVSEDYTYVGDHSSGLRVLDTSNPYLPSLVGTYNTPGMAQGVFISGDYAYVADGSTGLQILNISIPASPTFIGEFNTAGNARKIFVSGDYAYVADFNNGLEIINISDPSLPLHAGLYSSAWIMDVFIVNDYAYVADGINGLVVLDISDPSSPTLAGSSDMFLAKGVSVSGDYAYVADGMTSGLQIFNISDSSSPIYISYCLTPYNPEDIFVIDEYAYLAAENLEVINISDPSSPFLTGSYSSYYAMDVFVSGGYIYLADHTSGFKVLEARLIRARQFDSPCIAQSMVISTISSSYFESATLYSNDTIPVLTSISFYLSADNGLNWEVFTPGISNIFSNYGSQLRWQALLNTTDVLHTPLIFNLSIAYTTSLVAPSLTLPTDGFISDDYTPTFSWSGINGETYYLFQLDNTTSFTYPLLNITLPSSSTSYTPSSLLAPDTYYWRVAGIDSEDDLGSFSNYRSIIIIEDTQTPIIDHPMDVIYEEGEIGNSITWNPSDSNPYYYNITRNTTLLEHGITWDGESITIDVDGLAAGVYNFTCYVYDIEGLFAWDSVFVTVEIPVINEFTYLSVLSVVFFTMTLVVIYSKRKRKT